MVKSQGDCIMFGFLRGKNKNDNNVNITLSDDTIIIRKKPKYEVELTINDNTIRLSFPLAKNAQMARDYAVKYANEKYERETKAYVKIYNNNEKETEQSFKTF